MLKRSLLNLLPTCSTKSDYTRVLNRLFHVIVVVLYAILILTILITPYTSPYIFSHKIINHGWQYRNFLFSVWGTAVQFAYFVMLVAIDVLEIQGGPFALKLIDKLQRVASYLLFTFVFPVSVHIFILFWSFYAWDREYIYPKLLDQVAPFWLNHVFHTFPPALSVIYMLTCNKNEPTVKSTFLGLISLMTVYSIIFLYIKAMYGVYVYQIFDAFSDSVSKCLMLYCAFGVIPFLFLGHKLNKMLLDSALIFRVFNASISVLRNLFSSLREEMSLWRAAKSNLVARGANFSSNKLVIIECNTATN